MCSIIGLIDKYGQNISDLLVRMIQLTSHRGPDGCGIYVDGIIKKTNDLEELKIKNDKVKYIHRKVAQNLGVPSNLAWRKKQAAQHGSDVHNNLLTILEDGQDDEIQSSIHTMENLGSAYRYNNDTYKQNEAVQSVLNNIGEKLKLYPRMSCVS